MPAEKNEGVVASPPSLRSFLRSPWAALCLVMFLFVIYKSISSYEQHQLIRDFQGAYHQGSNSWLWDSKMDSKDKILFPQTFPNDDLAQYIQKHKLYPMDRLQSTTLIKYSPVGSTAERLSKPLKASHFEPYDIDLFHSSSNIKLDLQKCETKLREKILVAVDKPKGINVSLRTILTQLLKDLEHNSYFQELSPFFIEELALQIKYNVVEHYWYRLAGSSVYLEDYGVHFMISRVLYSPKGARNQPIISLTYAQLFDENWNELTNTKLVVPTNENDFTVMKFPSFLPIPFWFDVDNTEGKFYGPEDPRILLVRNPKGYEEPLVIFNAYHRKMTHFDDDADDHLVLKPSYYRSMFMCWPWQTQVGKENTDGLAAEEFKNSVYSRVVELQIKNVERRSKQKNWTPFVSNADRAVHGHDTHVNFIYRWANLEVLKCDMSTGECGFTYRLNNRLSTSARVGPLRGGTQLININGLIETHTHAETKSIIPPNREIWLGFARAHLDKCGCGNVMYRPNLVILVKDVVGDKQMFRLSHVSSSISFDIPMIGWNLNNPKDLCHGTNVLIPNGISSWVMSLVGEENGQFTADDDLTLSLSISDFTVHKINVKGLLNLIFAMDHDSLFFKPGEADKSSPDLKRLLLPNPKIVNDPHKVNSQWLVGFNNDNVACAMFGSSEYCAAYGLEQERLYYSTFGHEYEFEDDEFLEQQDASSVDKYEHELGMHHDDRINQVETGPPLRQGIPANDASGSHGSSHVPNRVNPGLINEYGKVDPEKMGSMFNGTIFGEDDKKFDDLAEADASSHRNSSKSYGHTKKLLKPKTGIEKKPGTKKVADEKKSAPKVENTKDQKMKGSLPEENTSESGPTVKGKAIKGTNSELQKKAAPKIAPKKVNEETKKKVLKENSKERKEDKETKESTKKSTKGSLKAGAKASNQRAKKPKVKEEMEA